MTNNIRSEQILADNSFCCVKGFNVVSCGKFWCQLSIALSGFEFLLSICELLLCEGVQLGSCAESECSSPLRCLFLSFFCLSLSFCCVKKFNLAPVAHLRPAQYQAVCLWVPVVWSTCFFASYPPSWEFIIARDAWSTHFFTSDQRLRVWSVISRLTLASYSIADAN